MADFISRIGPVSPAFPVRPVTAPAKGEQTGDDKARKRPSDKETDNEESGDDESPKHIDEHV
jgi:hypothetical protein